MLVSEMGRQESSDILARVGFGRLACAHENQPYIVPIYFAYEPDHLYGFATMGQKIEWMRLNPLVCVEVDEIHSDVDRTSIVVKGRYEELPEKPEYYSKMRRQAQALLEKRCMWWQSGFAAAQTRGQLSRDIPVFYCIHIEEITGHRASSGPTETR
jgi:nitroimidazol reductase NimA-like FMN-containing flavoprotein (pyridoxamine 5'-phosphate oxidase superfamily)